MIKNEYTKLANRFGKVMCDIGCEHLDISDPNAEIYDIRSYYGVEGGISIGWMYSEASYWLSCYYESGHCRCDDRHLSKEDYAIWKSETGKLKRLIAQLEKLEDAVIEC